MSMRNYGIYQQGAIFKQNDFAPEKVILAVCEKINNITLPDNIKKALQNNIFDIDIAVELCEILDIEHNGEIKDYSYISDKLISEACLSDWFEDSDTPLMGTGEISVYVFSEIEGDYYYDNDEVEEEYVEDGYMFSFYLPFVWNIKKHKNWHTRDAIVQKLREVSKPMLKDDIDWDKRLGSLIGSSFG